MKGSRMLMDMPYRYGGLFHDYSLDVEEWREIPKYRHRRRKTNHYDKCFCCGGEMLNSYSPSGELLKRNFPYLGEYRHERGREGGRCFFKIICRDGRECLSRSQRVQRT